MRSTIKIVILLFFICTSMSGASFPDMEKYMRQHALIWEQLPMQWNEGAFLGNGLVGMMVYADSTLNALVFHLGRPDVTDHRKAPYRKTSIGTEEADKILEKRGITVVPDIFANSGGVIVSYFEWVQNIQELTWERNQVNEMLESLMTKSFTAIMDVVEECKCTVRMAAYIVALRKLIFAENMKGIFP